MKKLLLFVLLGLFLVSCDSRSPKFDSSQTTLEDIETAEAHKDSLYIAVISEDGGIELYNPVTFEKEYRLFNYDGLSSTLGLIILIFFVAIIIGVMVLND